MTSLYPEVPGWIWVVLIVALVTGLNIWSVSSTSKVNTVLVGFAVVMIVAFIALAIVGAVVSALAGYLPARRASRVDPMEALRQQ